MRHHGRLAPSQAAATLPAERWRRALAASGAAAATAASFTYALGATLGDPPPLTAPGLGAYRLPLPPQRLRIPRKDAQVALVVCLGVGVDPGAATRLTRALRDAGCSVALVLDRSRSQRARELLAENSLVECVTLSSAELRDLLFADRPQDVLEGYIATQRPMTDLSPYQTTGGVDDDKLFFSRHSELQRLSAQGLRNLLIVRPRQMGKTSLLKALLRRMAPRDDVETHMSSSPTPTSCTTSPRAAPRSARLPRALLPGGDEDEQRRVCSSPRSARLGGP